MRAVVTVAFGNRPDVGKPQERKENLIGRPFGLNLKRWCNSFIEYGEGASLLAFRELPPASPDHMAVPYAFKVYALKAARQAGFTTLLWADSSVHPIRSLAPLWEQVKGEGYCIMDNEPWNCGEFTCDTALPVLEIDREEAFAIPQVCATVFALDLTNATAREFFHRYAEHAKDGSFSGPWINDQGQASSDPRVKGHRHDQTAASVIAWKMGMKLTPHKNVLPYGSEEDSRAKALMWITR